MRNKKGQFIREFDNRALIKFYAEYQIKEELREEALKHGSSFSRVLKNALPFIIKQIEKFID